MLKWHKEGVYAVDFGEILDAHPAVSIPPRSGNDSDAPRRAQGSAVSESGGELTGRKEGGLSRLQRQREEQVQRKHWVVAGAKDGKVSLWEVF